MGRGFNYVDRYYEDSIEPTADFPLPTRSTRYSAGYDFYAPETIEIPAYDRASGYKDKYKPFCIKTGVKAYMEPDEVLQLYIRSSAPSKLCLVMANSVGIIDSDYYGNADNDGEIGFLVYNLGMVPVIINKGDKIGQGIFTKFLKADNDNAQGSRVGGFGSTGV